MSEFRTVGYLPDRKNIRLQMDWDIDLSWYVLVKTEDIKSLNSSDTIMLNDKEVGWILEFKGVEADCLKFMDLKTEAIITIDPCNEKTRHVLSIYSIDQDDVIKDREYMAHKIEWYDIQGMEFDTNFFKEGHAYKIKIPTVGGDKYWVNALLKKITYDYLEFAYINPTGTLISSYTISVNIYKVRKKEDWYIALDPDDKWSDELEDKHETSVE